VGVGKLWLLSDVTFCVEFFFSVIFLERRKFLMGRKLLGNLSENLIKNL
jgi:hypothetical protein